MRPVLCSACTDKGKQHKPLQYTNCLCQLVEEAARQAVRDIASLSKGTGLQLNQPITQLDTFGLS